MESQWLALFTFWLATAALGGCQNGDAEACSELGYTVQPHAKRWMSPCKDMDPSGHQPTFIALCRFNSDICSNCVALSQYVDDAGVLSTSYTISACHVVTEKPSFATCMTGLFRQWSA